MIGSLAIITIADIIRGVSLYSLLPRRVGEKVKPIPPDDKLLKVLGLFSFRRGRTYDNSIDISANFLSPIFLYYIYSTLFFFSFVI